MDLFSGFAWPVPRAFASAVAACRFEQGDVLYDDASAYADLASPPSTSGEPARTWGEVARGLGYAVQVLDPPRSARNAPADASGNRFDANWASPVTVELTDYQKSSTSTAQTTQGRLFTCLWRDAPALLTGDGAPAPPAPATARELHGLLGEALPGVRRAVAKRRGAPLLFTFVVDESSEASLAKMRAVVAALGGHFAVRCTDLAPAEVGLDPEIAFHPALRLCACGIETADEAAVRDLLKGVLYAPTRAADPPPTDAPDEAAPVADRFRLERHGVLASATG